MSKYYLLYFILGILFILAILYIYKFETYSFINSHFGSNHSSAESDNKERKTESLISKLYDKEIYSQLKNCPFKTYYNAQPPPTIDISELTYEKFIKLSNNFRRPIVVKRFLLNTPALDKWNLDYFKNNYGNTKLPVIENALIENHSKFMNGCKVPYSFHYLNNIINDIYNHKPIYVNNVSKIFSQHPELIEDMELKRLFEFTKVDIYSKNSKNIVNMFLGGKDTGTSLHCALSCNFFYNIKGRKKWYLIHPKYSKYLLPRLSRTGLFAVSYQDICNAKPGDPILNIPRYEIELDEGDFLFNSPWWWHAVKNIGMANDKEQNYTLGCANRFSNFKVGFKNNPLYTSIFFSHPIANYNDFNGGAKTREEANAHFEKSLLKDIYREKKIISEND
jgi:hypothetical protein